MSKLTEREKYQLSGPQAARATIRRMIETRWGRYERELRLVGEILLTCATDYWAFHRRGIANAKYRKEEYMDQPQAMLSPTGVAADLCEVLEISHADVVRIVTRAGEYELAMRDRHCKAKYPVCRRLLKGRDALWYDLALGKLKAIFDRYGLLRHDDIRTNVKEIAEAQGTPAFYSVEEMIGRKDIVTLDRAKDDQGKTYALMGYRGMTV